ncbi:hypothetical protein A0E43_18710 [Pectobacterium cacticida]
MESTDSCQGSWPFPFPGWLLLIEPFPLAPLPFISFQAFKAICLLPKPLHVMRQVKVVDQECGGQPAA